MQDIAFAIRWMERGLVPDTVVRQGIRRLPKDWFAELPGFHSGQGRWVSRHLLERRG